MEDRPIQRLTDELIGMIAAGEVVENPSSAIKEMVENSLDAGASSVTVEIREGGISYIRVTDNGKGIRERDIRMAFERHATSKITAPEDLYDLRTLGFRGEALASIAAVSKVTLTTRSREEENGLRVVNEGGEIVGMNAAASPQGTTIVVRDLFYNTPVRLKFLKKANTEAVKVADVISRFILSRPEVSFRLISNGKQVYASTGSGDLKSAVFALYGRETAANVIPVHLDGSVSIQGYIGVGDEARSSRNRQTYIVNGRNIHSALLSSALEEGCRERFTVGHYPMCVLKLDMPGTMVDVNVHPNKLEVRFSDERLIFGKVLSAVQNSFPQESFDSAPKMILPEEKPITVPQAAIRVISTTTEEGLQAAKAAAAVTPSEAAPLPKNAAPEKPETSEPEEKEQPASARPSLADMFPVGMEQGAAYVSAVPSAANKKEEQTASLSETAAAAAPSQLDFAPYLAPAAEASAPSSASVQETDALIPPVKGSGSAAAAGKEGTASRTFRGYQLVGVIFDTYIILQNDEQILFVDQHAAHERILYERLMKQIDLGSGSQQLLVPQIVHVTPQDRERIENYRQEIEGAGYEVDDFGDNAYQIRAVPNVLGEPESRGAFMDMVDRLSELSVLMTKQKRRDAILQMACKKAIKGGDRITQAEIITLLDQMGETDAPPTCPHGRPLVVTLSRHEIEKRFKRINQ